jgi:hypothetical protein
MTLNEAVRGMHCNHPDCGKRIYATEPDFDMQYTQDLRHGRFYTYHRKCLRRYIDEGRQENPQE